jgi:hypothetical protein
VGRNLRSFLLQGFRWILKDGTFILDVANFNICSDGFLVDRPYQLLGKNGGNRLKQRHEGSQEAQ